MTYEKDFQLDKFSFSSSVKDDVWHSKPSAEGYEWWYFDALSDDGKDAIVIIFLDNFIFSPQYNRKVQSSKFKVQNSAKENLSLETSNPKSDVPAVAFVYYRNGKPLYRAINEFAMEEFYVEGQSPSCRIGESSFKFESAPYGSGYILSVKAQLPRRRRLEAQLEWLSIESNLTADEKPNDQAEKHNWNLVAPRSDVTGSIKVSDSKGKLLDVKHFRGTGYHDHNWDTRWLPSTVKDWQWGRAHFDEYTAVYYRYREVNSSDPAAAVTKLILIKDNKFEIFDAVYQEEKMRRNLFSVKFPKQITFAIENNFELKITQSKTIDESFFYLRFLSEAELKSPDGKVHEASAVTEHLAPKNLKYRWLDWLVNMRIGRNGKGSFL